MLVCVAQRTGHSRVRRGEMRGDDDDTKGSTMPTISGRAHYYNCVLVIYLPTVWPERERETDSIN